MPEYRIGADLIRELTGEDSDAEYALLRGHVRLKDIPADLLGNDNEVERIAWIIGRIPEDELAKRKTDRDELMSLIGDFDISGSAEEARVAKENDDA